ncbi:MAG: phage holin family protein [Verrucomicrobia bacterium]|nr:phage holin family protein [Verrucomicrobiota bacterium]
MAFNPLSSAGFMGALRNLCEGLIASVEQRIALLSAELQEEKLRLIQIFIWISAVVFSGMMAITFASLLLVYLFWESARLWVLGGLAGLYAAVFVAVLIAFRRYLSRQPQPFAATISELAEDRACILAKN